jgi:cobalt-zinc-cadmium resistance protein CzcA
MTIPTERSTPTVIARVVTACFARLPLVVLLVGAATLVGGLAAANLRRDVLPDLASPVFNVIVQNAAMTPEELETAIAIPFESALAGLPDIRRVRSVSQLGVSQITVEFDTEADYFRSRQFVAERVNQASAQLPPGTEPPLISSLTGRLNEIFEFTLEAEAGAADLMTLRDLAEFEVRNRLLAVPGVSAVERLGGYFREFQVLIDPDRMVARDVTLAELRHAVQESNENASGGLVTQGAIEWGVRVIGRVANVADLRATVVAIRGGVPVLVGDVAEVREGPAVRRGLAHRLQGEVVSCRVVKQFGADTVAVAAGIRAAIDDLRRGLPEGVTLRTVYDQSELVNEALGGVTRAVLLGGVGVVMVLLLLLGDVRAALLVTLTIPVSIALASILLERLGVGLNTMTLGGLALAVGLLVDASIIVTENILHRLQETSGADRRRTALDAAIEVARPIAFAVLIVVAVFAPLFAMTGIEGRMYRPLAAAVVTTLAASLLLALTAVPALAALVLRPAPSARPDMWVVRWLKRYYDPILNWCLSRAGVVRVGSVVLAVPFLVLGARLGSDFIPPLNEGAFLLQTIVPAEASLAQVDQLNHRVEDILREFPEVDDVVRRTGRAERTEDPMPHTLSDVLVVLKPQVTGDLAALEDRMREALEDAPGIAVLFTTPLGMRIDEGLGGTPADLSVRVFGPDLPVLAKLATEAMGLIETVPGLVDLRAEPLSGIPQIRVVVDRPSAARAGLAPGDIVDAVRTSLVGDDVSEVWIGQRRFDLVIRVDAARRNDLNAIANLLIDTHSGVRVPLTKVATLEQGEGPAAIRREGGSRRLAVEASVSGRDLGRTAAEVGERLREGLTLPPGYFVDIGGRVESQTRAAAALMVAVGVALFAVFVLLYMALGSFRETAVILFTLPMASVGAILALVLAGETWNVSSLVGLIGLFGIAVQNSLVLVTQTHGLRQAGLAWPAAIREASIGRVRPKLMTAGAAILGLLPILALRLPGTEIERPLAIVMVGGLVTSTLFTLLVLPAFLVWLGDATGHREP